MPSLKLVVTANSAAAQAELKKLEALAKATGLNVSSGLAGGAHGAAGLNTGAMREALVLLREIGRGNWTRVPGSLSILLSRLGLFSVQFLAFAAIAGITFLKLENIVKGATARFEEMAEKAKRLREATRESFERHQAYTDWLDSVLSKEESLAEKTENTVRQMREKYKLLEKMKGFNGGGEQERKMEESVIKAAIQTAQSNLQAAVNAGNEAERKAGDPKVLAEVARAKKVEEERDAAFKAAGEFSIFDPLKHPFKNAAEEKVKEIRLAKKELDDAANTANRESDDLKKRQDDAAKAKEAITRAKSDLDRLTAMLNREDGETPESPRHGRGHNVINERQRLGLEYAGGAPGKLDAIHRTLQQIHIDLTRGGWKTLPGGQRLSLRNGGVAGEVQF